MHKKEKGLYVGHWITVKKQLKEGTAKSCFCTDMAEMQKRDGFSDDLAGYISGSFLEAGSDTTSSTLYGFVQAMLLFHIDNEPNLQYIRGCVKESLRWMPTAITGAAPRACTKDDEYMGFHIPNGAIILNNVYTINMDSKRFPNLREFNLDRYRNDFLNAAKAATANDVSKRDHFTFGGGRHLCQGMHVAERSLYLGISRILWAFDILPALNESGKEIIPDSKKLTQGLVTMPEIFPARFVPRSKERAELIEREWAEAKKSLDPVKMQWLDLPEGLKFKSV